jgi:hypothetical protein
VSRGGRVAQQGGDACPAVGQADDGQAELVDAHERHGVEGNGLGVAELDRLGHVRALPG